MALELGGFLDFTGKAETDMSDKQYYALELTGEGLLVDVPDNAGDLVIGVIQNKTPLGGAVAIRSLGITKWVSDGSGTAITVGARVGTNNVGKCVVKTANNALTAGIALSPSNADGIIIDVLLTIGANIGV